MKTNMVKSRLICCIVILSCMFTTLVNAQESPSINDIEMRFETFRVINYKNSTFCNDNTLTRGKMAEIIGRLQGYSIPNVLPPTEYCFSDVNADHPEYIWILMAKNAQYIRGNGQDCFAPDEAITEIDAVKMLLSLAGYDWLAEQCGSYPEGYITVGKMLRIVDGELLDNPIHKDKFLKILNKFIDLYPASVNDNGIFRVHDNHGTIKNWMKLESYNIKDPFEVK